MNSAIVVDKKRIHKFFLFLSGAALIPALGLSLFGCQARNYSTVAPPADIRSGIARGRVATGNEDWAHSIVALAARDTDNKLSVYCTGSLIKPNVVLTAAHCVVDETRPVFVVFGAAQNHSLDAHPALKIVVHEKYDKSKPDDTRDASDIALVTFAGPAPRGFHPFQLLPDSSRLKKGVISEIAGYGQVDPRVEDPSGTLRYGTVVIDDPHYSPSEASADETGSATCFGDSGGPIMLPVKDVFYLWGVVSSGDNACKEYGVYTVIPAHRAWLERHLQ